MFPETAEVSVPLHEEKLSEETKAELQKCYEENQSLTTKRRNQIAEKLGLDPNTVKIWFENELAEKKKRATLARKAAKKKKDAQKKRDAEWRKSPFASMCYAKFFVNITVHIHAIYCKYAYTCAECINVQCAYLYLVCSRKLYIYTDSRAL